MILGLLESGQKVSSISEEYGLDQSMIRRWRREHQGSENAFSGRGVSCMREADKRVAALEKELKEVRMERGILKKAVSIFSKGDRKSTSL